VAGPVEIEWSLDALADLDRFAAFLHGPFPELAARVARALIARADVLRRHPKVGQPIGNREEYREVLLQVLGGTYALPYRYDGSAVLMLRAFQDFVDSTICGRRERLGRDRRREHPAAERLAIIRELRAVVDGLVRAERHVEAALAVESAEPVYVLGAKRSPVGTRSRA
jgi:plasmid stabilization system protein ParE